VADAETMLRELGILLGAEQRQLLETFQERQARFIDAELTSALNELHIEIEQLSSARLADRTTAFDRAAAITQLRIERWLERIEPEADALYRNATERFYVAGQPILDPSHRIGRPRVRDAAALSRC